MSAAGLVVEHDYPAAWRAVPDLPLFAGEPWHRAMGRRFDGEAVWLWTPARDAGPAAASGTPARVGAGLAGFVVSRPEAYVYGNAAALLTDPGSPFASDDVAARLAGGVTDPGWLLPHLLLTFPGYSTFPVGDDRGDEDALRRTLEQVLAWAAGERLAAVALPYVASASPLARAARALGFHGWRLTEDSALDVPDGGFDGHLAGMGSHRRQRIRAERRRLRERGIRGRRVAHVPPALLDRMAQLRVRQRSKYGLAANLADERARLQEITTTLADRVDVFVAEDADPAADPGQPGFALFVRDGDTWHGLAVGVDDEDPRTRSTYFEVAYYAPLDAAEACGIRRISYGLAASHAKRLRGCVAQPVDCLLAGLSATGRAAAARLHAAWTAPRPLATAGSAG